MSLTIRKYDAADDPDPTSDTFSDGFSEDCLSQITIPCSASAGGSARSYSPVPIIPAASIASGRDSYGASVTSGRDSYGTPRHSPHDGQVFVAEEEPRAGEGVVLEWQTSKEEDQIQCRPGVRQEPPEGNFMFSRNLENVGQPIVARPLPPLPVLTQSSKHNNPLVPPCWGICDALLFLRSLMEIHMILGGFCGKVGKQGQGIGLLSL